ncbi:MAG: excinuclease ABC subunit UvrA [Actinomycetota bacterium]|nr:excinuclease ABC subunit UvrA [Actinomycetota bacterium]
MEKIIIRGAREHNLKSINLDIPRDRLIVITGLSGSGKSSLAMDTIYAEGQRRYVESLSAYARQFLGQMQKPDLDHIEGLSPAVAIDQKSTSRNPRSTVGTITEIYDYLRVLYARIGLPSCHICGAPISRQSPEQIIEQILRLEAGAKFFLLAPVIRGKKGEHGKIFEDLRGRGFSRVRVDGEVLELASEIRLDKYVGHSIEVVVDRLVMKEGIERRLADSIETALELSDGLVTILKEDGDETTYSQKFACLKCEISFDELSPRMFSFNSPYGACKVCTGLGSTKVVDPSLVVPDPSLSLNEGAIAPFYNGKMNFYPSMIRSVAERFDIDMDKPFLRLSEHEKGILFFGSEGERVEITYRNQRGQKRVYRSAFEGVISNLERRYKESDSDYSREKIEQYMREMPCVSCGGARLKPESLAVTFGGVNIYEFTKKSAKDALVFWACTKIGEREKAIGAGLIKEIEARLKFLVDVGLGYITIDRPAATLAGGEAQRIRLATQIGSGLVGVLYILDEPSIGLHQRDNVKLIETLKNLKELGNTVIVIEHDEDTIRAADFIIDIGPGAGAHGGRVVAAGPLEQVMKSKDSLTAKFLSGELKIEVPKERRRVEPDRTLTIRGAKEHNLKGIDVAIPLGLFVCVTGVSGSGKSTLISDVLHSGLRAHFYNSRERVGAHDGIDGLELIDKVVNIDQSPIGRTPRSNPATYTKVFDEIRFLFSQTKEAKLRGYKQGRFSFNVTGGRCEACRGDGTIKVEMHFLPDVYIPCEVCKGKRYNRETLQVHFKGKNIADVLEMSVEEALTFFENIPKIQRRLQTLFDVGLGYIKLGQSAITLSGGEAQRIKLSAELSKRATGKTLYILDEPTTGLHLADIEKLLTILTRLVDEGNSVLVIEHQLDVIKTADHLIDLGPEGGEEGGYVIATGTPEEVVKNKASYTGRFLKQLL